MHGQWRVIERLAGLVHSGGYSLSRATEANASCP